MADQSRDELACVYAALVLLDDDVAITVNIFILIFPYWNTLVAVTKFFGIEAVLRC